MSPPASAAGWADEQRALRDRAAVPGFVPDLQPVGYRVLSRPDDASGLRGLWRKVVLVGLAAVAFLVDEPEVVRVGVAVLGLGLIARWFWSGAGTGRYVALSVGSAPVDGVPTLVFAVGDGVLADAPPIGRGDAFGDLGPGGALGLLVGGTTVWPAWPPRAGTARDVERRGRPR